MRKRIYFKNSLYSVFNYLLVISLSLVVRKVLVECFPIEYVGYESVFADIFTLLSIADMGMESIITYNLYDSLVRDREQIPRVMYQARRMYTNIAIVVVLIGITFLPFISGGMSENTKNRELIIVIYIIQVVNLGISYYTGYKRLLLLADQKEYLIIKWDSLILILVQVSRIIVLLCFHNYCIYVGLCIIQTLAQNIGINIKCNREYGLLLKNNNNVSGGMPNVKKDMGNFLCHRISSIVYSATDNIIISSILGLSVVGLYSNYYMVAKYTYSFSSRMMKPMQASIGNFLYSSGKVEKKIGLLSMLNIVAFIVASWVFHSLLQLSTPFITWWLGTEYIQNQTLVFLLAFNFFIAINQDFIYFFRNSYGEYEYDKKYMIVSAIVNLFFSVVLGIIYGLEGIVVATIMGHMFIWYGRVKFVYKHLFGLNIRKYWIGQFKTIGILVIQYILIVLVVKDHWSGFLGCLWRELCVVAVCLVTDFIFFFQTVKAYLCAEE